MLHNTENKHTTNNNQTQLSPPRPIELMTKML